MAKLLFSQIFNGENGGKHADPGMAGSLLYHMAMVTKMESETRALIEELHVDLPDISINLDKIYSDFESDVKELTMEVTPFTLSFHEVASTPHLGTAEKISLFINLTNEKKAVESLLEQQEYKSICCTKKIVPFMGRADYTDAFNPRVRNNKGFTSNS